MKTRWILVADRAHAKIYQQKGRDTPVVLLHDIENPEGKLQPHELKSDKQGASFSSSSYGHNSMSSEVDPVETILERFAKQLSETLVASARKKEFDELVVCAGPHFLGRIRPQIAKHSEIKVIGELEKDYVHCAAKELQEHISHLSYSQL